MPLVTTNEFNEDTRGKYDTVVEWQISTMPQFPQLPPVQHVNHRRCSLVLGYESLLPPQYLQTEIPAVSHFFLFHTPLSRPGLTKMNPSPTVL